MPKNSGPLVLRAKVLEHGQQLVIRQKVGDAFRQYSSLGCQPLAAHWVRWRTTSAEPALAV